MHELFKLYTKVMRWVSDVMCRLCMALTWSNLNVWATCC